MFIYWRASVASEKLTGVTQLKIGDVCLSVCMDVRMSFCTLTHRTSGVLEHKWRASLKTILFLLLNYAYKVKGSNAIVTTPLNCLN